MATAFDSYSDARAHFKDLLDAAARGEAATIRRDGGWVAVVDGQRFRDSLALAVRTRPSVLAEAGGWSVFVPGLPIAADGKTLDAAVNEMVDALREYVEDWNDHLRTAPNHRDHWAIVQLVSLSDNDELRAWITGEPPATRA